MKYLNQILAFCVVLLFSTMQTFAQRTNDDRIMLQGFYWESAANNPDNWYNVINNKSQEIADMGIDMIWLPPPSDAGSLEGYLPRELNNFANNYGSLANHRAMLNALNSKGIDPIADIVINHRVGNTNYVDFANPAWGTDAITSNDEVWSVPQYYNVYPRGGNDTGTSYEAARDIDHTKQYVQNSVIDFLNNLKTLGYSGWRYDFVHGFDPYYFTLYNNATNPSITVGENYNSNKQVVQDWINNTGSAAFDFPTYFTLKAAVRDNNYSYLVNSGAASGGIGWDSRNYVTFIENHDTPRYDTPNNVLNAGNVGQTYAYLLTHPGVPCIYWPHLMDWGNGPKTEITELIAVRKDAGIHSQSNLSIEASQNGLYAAIIDGDNYQVAMKLGPNDWSPSGSGWNLASSGNNFAVWTKNSSSSTPVNTSFKVYTQDYSTIYSWDNGLNATNGGWPGTSLVNEGNGWFSGTVQGDCSNLIFSNNGASQTANLYTCSSTPYYYQGNWYANPPVGGGNSNTMTVYVQGYTHLYSWDDNLNATNGGWPGVALSNAGNGYMSATISSNCSNLIFSNNGSNQTSDLYTCSDATYYFNNQWNAAPQKSASLNNESESSIIYPNPVNEHSVITLYANTSVPSKLSIYNISGQLLSNTTITVEKGRNDIPFSDVTSSLKSGIYICKVENENQTTFNKFVVN